MSDHGTSSRLLKVTRIFTPLRIISILTLLPIFIFRISFDSASIIYYSFFIVFFSSFAVEIIQFVRNRRELARLAIKYMLILPFEFIGVFVFTMASLPFPNTEEIHELEIKIAIIVVGTSMIVELYYYITLSREKFQLDLPRILALIPMAVLIVYEGIFIYLFLYTA